MSTSDVLPDRVHQQLLFRPPPLNGEAVCSWLYRIAVENGHCTAGPLIKLARLNEKVPLSASELTAEMLEWLCAATGCSEQEITACLKDIVGEALGAAPRRSSRRWLLRNSKRSVGQRFSLCQYCLAQDIPYWRGAWRFATTVRCDVHDTALIDQCPACDALQLLSLQRARPLDECEECGAKLAMVSPQFTRCQSKLSGIGSGLTWAPPGVVELREFPVQVPCEHLFWDGVWTILSHALLRDIAQRLQAVEIPLRARSLLLKVANAPQRTTFEDLPVADRQVMLEFSRWLCEDWPRRFVEVFEQGRVLASTFGVREVDRPYWIDRAVDEHLNRQRYRPSVDEVQSAASWLASQQGAARPSRLRLKQTLGITESIQISKVLQVHTRPFTLCDLALLLRALQDEIDSTDARRSRRDAVVRDALLVASCVLRGQGISAACKLTFVQIHVLWDTRKPRALGKARTWELLCEWRSEYESKVRPRWSGPEAEGSCYFVTRHGLPYQGYGLPRLLTRCLKNIGYPDHWRGAGVLRDLRDPGATTSTPPQSR